MFMTRSFQASYPNEALLDFQMLAKTTWDTALHRDHLTKQRERRHDSLVSSLFMLLKDEKPAVSLLRVLPSSF